MPGDPAAARRDRSEDVAAIAALAGSRGRVLDLTGAGTVRDADCRDLRWTEVAIRGEQSYWRSALHRVTGRGVVPHFVRCDFSGMRVGGLTVHARFSECRFADVRVRLARGTTQTDLVGCTFSGTWEGNVSAAHGHRVEGNDFRGVRGIGFRDGVDWRANTFDHGGTQLVLTRTAAAGAGIVRVAGDHPMLAVVVRCLRNGRPVDLGQDWALLSRDDFTAEQWDAVVGAAGG
jgi:hypothetical protein